MNNLPCWIRCIFALLAAASLLQDRFRCGDHLTSRLGDNDDQSDSRQICLHQRHSLPPADTHNCTYQFVEGSGASEGFIILNSTNIKGKHLTDVHVAFFQRICDDM